MSSDGGDTPRLDIRSARELFAAVRSPDEVVRASILAAISQHPQEVLRYRMGEETVLDVLLTELGAATCAAHRRLLIGALVHYDDPRVVSLFRDLLRATSEPEIARLCVRRLALDRSEETRKCLLQQLYREDSVSHLQLVAPLLAGSFGPEALEPRARVRMRILGKMDPADAPVLRAPEDASAWVAELSGSLGLHARRALERDATGALANLATHWGALDREHRLWLLERAQHTPDILELDSLVGLLAQSDAAVVVGALRVLARLPKPPRSALPQLRKLVVARNAEIRLGALAAAGDHVGVDWRAIAKADESPVVRALAVERWGATRAGRAVATDLARCLRAERDWQPRAALTEALSRMGDVGVEAVTPLLDDEHDDARAAAVTVLLRNGREAWLAARFLA